MKTAKRHVAVVGCGPAGMAAALLLHRDGHRVTVFDQFAAPRPIGSGLMLQPTGLKVLDMLGLREQAEAHGAVIHRMFGRVEPSGRTVLDVSYDPTGRGRHGVAIHRAALFAILHRSLQDEGIGIETSRTIADVDDSGGGAILLDDAARRYGPFDLIVDASGLRSPLAALERNRSSSKSLPFGALWASLEWPEAPFAADKLEQRYRGAHTMAGVLPIGRRALGDTPKAAFFWSLPADGYGAWRSAGLERWKESVLALWPATEVLLAQITHPEQLTMARYYHVTLRRPYRGPVIHIGDSAHATSPQLGQGANMALIDAAALAQALRDYGDLDQAAARYHQLRRIHVAAYQLISAIFTPFYQSASPVLPLIRDHVLWPLSRIPPAPALLSAMARGELAAPFRGLPQQRA